MDAKTLKALRESIDKWERNATARRRKDVRTGSRDCPLCKLFSDDWCVGCPVYSATGKDSCLGTPYEFVIEYLHFGLPLERIRAAARKEVTFLQSLWPAGAEIPEGDADAP